MGLENMETEAEARVTLRGVFDRTVVEEAALAVDDMDAGGSQAPVVDCALVSDVLVDGMLMLRTRAVLHRCRWENAPAALRHYARLLGIALHFDAPSPPPKPLPGTPGPVVACGACGRPMRLGNGRWHNYACPHCGNHFHADAAPSRTEEIARF